MSRTHKSTTKVVKEIRVTVYEAKEQILMMV